MYQRGLLEEIGRLVGQVLTSPEAQIDVERSFAETRIQRGIEGDLIEMLDILQRIKR